MKKKMLLSSVIALSMVGLCATTASADVIYNEDNYYSTDLYVDSIEINTSLFDITSVYDISTGGLITTKDSYKFLDGQITYNTEGNYSMYYDVTYNSPFYSNELYRTFEAPYWTGNSTSDLSVNINHNFVLNETSDLKIQVPNDLWIGYIVQVTLLDYQLIDNKPTLIQINKEYDEIDVDVSYDFGYTTFSISQIYNKLNIEYGSNEYVLSRFKFQAIAKNNLSEDDSLFVGIIEDYYDVENWVSNQKYVDVLDDKLQNLGYEFERDYTSWLITAVGGFMDFEIVPGFSVGGMFSIVAMIALVAYILKMFLGG